ncbi:hypothetical protein ACFYOD_11040 [Streptomyces sp. NPDC006703]
MDAGTRTAEPTSSVAPSHDDAAGRSAGRLLKVLQRVIHNVGGKAWHH